MPAGFTTSLNILHCYAPEDRHWLREIDRCLKPLRNECELSSWFDGELVPAADEKKKLLALFRRTDIVILLVSRHFKNVATFWDELGRKKNRMFAWPDLCRVAMILLEPVDWSEAPFATRDMLPRTAREPIDWQHPEPFNPTRVFPSDLRALTEWPNRDLAFREIEQGMRTAIEEHWLIHGDYCRTEGGGGGGNQDKLALIAYNEALRLNPAIGRAWYGKAHVLVELNRYEEALEACEEALRLDSVFPWSWYVKGNAFAGLHRYKEALEAYDEALRLNPSNRGVQQGKENALKALEKGMPGINRP